MADRDDDLDWLYGRDRRQTPDPEATRVLPPPGGGPPTGAGPPPGAGRPSPGGAPPRDAGPPTQPFSGPGRDPGPATQPFPAPVRSADQVLRPVPAGPPPPPGTGSSSPSRAGAPPPVAPPPRTRPTSPPPPRARRPGRRVLAVLGALLALLLVGLVGIPAYAWSRVQRVDDQPAGDRPADQPGTAILVVGSDSREGLTAEERRRLGTGRTAGNRTDTIMIMYSPPDGDPALISLPRDSYVQVPKNGRNKINAAYAFGGPELLVQTVEANTGLRMDGYAEIGFGGFVNIVDAVGGVEMCLPKAIKDRDSHLDLPKGCQNLDGSTALGYVRMRKADARGDLGRVERQRQVLAAVATKAATPWTVLNPVRYWSLTTTAVDAVKVGEETSLRQMASTALAIRRIAGGQGTTLTVPVADDDASTPAGSAVLWNEKRAEAMFADLARGDTSNLAEYAR